MGCTKHCHIKEKPRSWRNGSSPSHRCWFWRQPAYLKQRAGTGLLNTGTDLRRALLGLIMKMELGETQPKPIKISSSSLIYFCLHGANTNSHLVRRAWKYWNHVEQFSSRRQHRQSHCEREIPFYDNHAEIFYKFILDHRWCSSGEEIKAICAGWFGSHQILKSQFFRDIFKAQLEKLGNNWTCISSWELSVKFTSIFFCY